MVGCVFWNLICFVFVEVVWGVGSCFFMFDCKVVFMDFLSFLRMVGGIKKG